MREGFAPLEFMEIAKIYVNAERHADMFCLYIDYCTKMADV